MDRECYAQPLVAGATALAGRGLNENVRYILNMSGTFQIKFKDLWTYSQEDPNERVEIRRLSPDGEHVHGELSIMVSNRLLPHIGFFGPSDACFNEWVVELARALSALESSEVGEYKYDEGEQGQPAFLFQRQGEKVFISIVESVLSGSEGDPDWQRVECLYKDVVQEIKQFLAGFRAEISSKAPAAGAQWWANVVEQNVPNHSLKADGADAPRP